MQALKQGSSTKPISVPMVVGGVWVVVGVVVVAVTVDVVCPATVVEVVDVELDELVEVELDELLDVVVVVTNVVGSQRRHARAAV